MKSFFRFVVMLALTMNGSFVILAAGNRPSATPSLSKEWSGEAGDKTGDTVPREFLGFTDVSEFLGVIDDPDGYVNLRKDKRADAAVVTKVKAGEIFQFKKKEGDGWCQVKLKSGVSGWTHCSRIKP